MAKKATRSDAEKSAKWKELAEKRANRIIKGIESLSKLSAKSRYSYTPKQIETLKEAFEAAFDECFARYAGSVTKTSGLKL